MENGIRNIFFNSYFTLELWLSMHFFWLLIHGWRNALLAQKIWLLNKDACKYILLFMFSYPITNQNLFHRMHSVILSMESILFGLFVIAIMCDQFSAIFSDETAVEQVNKRHYHSTNIIHSFISKVKKQGPYRSKRPKMSLLREICGRTHPIMWLFPCSSAPKGPEMSYTMPI